MLLLIARHNSNPLYLMDPTLSILRAGLLFRRHPAHITLSIIMINQHFFIELLWTAAKMMGWMGVGLQLVEQHDMDGSMKCTGWACLHLCSISLAEAALGRGGHWLVGEFDLCVR